MRRFLASMIGFVCIGAAPAPTSQVDFTDLTDEFALYWEQSQGKPDAERAADFRSYFAQLIPGFYDPARNSVDPARYDRFVANALRAFTNDRTRIEDVSRRFSGLLQPALQDFESRVGPLGEQRVILLHSLGEMDGGVRTLQGRRTLVFGADRIAELHANHRIEPFFHHELFHQYHAQYFSGCDAFWCALWSEGLAVYAAKQLTPDATDGELLLDVPKPIRVEVESNRQLAVCTLAAKLDSTEQADFRALFSFDRPHPSLPARYGYYIGYLAAERLGRNRSLGQLAELTTDQAQPLVAEALRRLSECPPSS